MKRYVDTSILFSLYITDANSVRVDAWRLAYPSAINFTSFHRVEIRNALSLAVFQKCIKTPDSEAAWEVVREDLAAGRLINRPVSWARSLAKAEELAELHTPSIGSRSLDVLHVAAALVSGATEFHTFDLRQGKLAKAAGLLLP